ncbi:MAG: hypothetical protein JNG88_10325 [Phycisphaerales bacterium]|nr:hypothetical protein [Phycisphaerales bacterium]
MFLIMCKLLLVIQNADDRPRALIAFEESRRSLLSGTIEWTRVDLTSAKKRTLHYVSRFAMNGDMILEDRGDQDGWVWWDDAKQQGISKFPQLILRNRQGVWEHSETSFDSRWWRAEELLHNPNVAPHAALLDPRFLGMHYQPETGLTQGVSCLWKPDTVYMPSSVKWSESERNGRFEVVAELGSGGRALWIIDPDRGWNAERIVAQFDSGTIEVECDLIEQNGVWFPREVVQSVNGERTQIFRITDRTLNAPDAPVQFSVLDIGFEPGFNIVPQNFRSTTRPEMLIWNGEAIVDVPSFQRDVRAGLRKPGPTLERFARGQPSPYMTPDQIREREARHRAEAVAVMKERGMSDWERYTRLFVERYSLDSQQAEKAMQTLRQCQEDGRRIIARDHTEYAKIARVFEKLRGKPDPDRHAALQRDLVALRKPIDKIFETKLKPGLERLPTKEQRQRASSSQPAAEPTKK